MQISIIMFSCSYLRLLFNIYYACLFIAELQKKSTEEYKLWTAEQEKLETFKRSEEERINEEENEKWLRTELIAQVQWRQLQEKISKARFERAQQDLRIKKVFTVMIGVSILISRQQT